MDKLKAVRIFQLTEANLQHYLKDLVSCYRRVFGGEDWREWKLCPSGHKFSFSKSADLDFCPVCGQKLSYYWPAETVEKNILYDFYLPQSVFVIAVDGQDRVIGFTWGYAMDKVAAREKFDGHLPNNLIKLLGKQKYFWYQNEIGVAEEYRHLGLASRLYKMRMSLVLEKYDCQYFLIRSHPQAKTYHWYQQKIGYRFLSKYYRPDIREWRYILYANRQSIAAYLKK